MTTKQPAVYILASRLNGTLYTGVTSDLVRRIYEHRNNLADGFTKRYGVHSLVYYELHGDMSEAIHREKQIKKWNRQWKVSLIEQGNPEWHDLWPEITGNEEDGFPHTRERQIKGLTCAGMTSCRMALPFSSFLPPPSFPRRREPTRRTKDGFPHTRE